MFAPGAIANLVEVGERAVFLELCQAIGNGDFAPNLELGRPEVVLDNDLLDGHGGERGRVGEWRGSRCAETAPQKGDRSGAAQEMFKGGCHGAWG